MGRKAIARRGDEVVVYDLDTKPVRIAKITSPRLMEGMKIVAGQIEDTAGVKSVVKDEGITHIVHLAAVLMPFCQAQPVMGGLIDVSALSTCSRPRGMLGRPYASCTPVPPRSGARSMPTNTGSCRKKTRLKPATHYGVFKQANEGNARAFYRHRRHLQRGPAALGDYGFGRDLGLTADPTFAMQAVAHNRPFQIRLSGPWICNMWKTWPPLP